MSSINARVYLAVRKGYLMCSQMTDVVMRLLWLTQQNQLVLRETPGGIDDHAHRLHPEEVAKIVTTIPVLVTRNNRLRPAAMQGMICMCNNTGSVDASQQNKLFVTKSSLDGLRSPFTHEAIYILICDMVRGAQAWHACSCIIYST